MRPIEMHTERMIFSCSLSEAVAMSSEMIDSLLLPANTNPRARAAASPMTDVLALKISLSLSATFSFEEAKAVRPSPR